MALSPLCKTAVISYIIDESVSNLWNVSSLMRKRVKMILENRLVTIQQYSEKALALNGWISLNAKYRSIRYTEDIKKGVSNYKIKSEADFEKVVSLNQKLRCHSIDFKLEAPFQCDLIEELRINTKTLDFYLKCSFNKLGTVYLNYLSSTQITQFLSKTSYIAYLSVNSSTISKIDLSPFKIKKLRFFEVNFNGKVHLPSNLQHLSVLDSKGLCFLKNARVTEINSWGNKGSSKESLPKLISSLKSLKKAYVDLEMAKHVGCLPSTVRYINYFGTFDYENTDLVQMRANLPFLIHIQYKIPIKVAQALNLKKIMPIVDETEEKFTLRPREIEVGQVENLSNHPELFEKVEIVTLYCHGFNFDCFPKKIKKLVINCQFMDKEDFKCFERNSSKFEEADVEIWTYSENVAEPILGCLARVRTVSVHADLDFLIEEYPHLKFKAF